MSDAQLCVCFSDKCSLASAIAIGIWISGGEVPSKSFANLAAFVVGRSPVFGVLRSAC
jgi:hypothetical protein